MSIVQKLLFCVSVRKHGKLLSKVDEVQEQWWLRLKWQSISLRFVRSGIRIPMGVGPLSFLSSFPIRLLGIHVLFVLLSRPLTSGPYQSDLRFLWIVEENVLQQTLTQPS